MSFDVLAPHYRWMEFVLAGQKLQRCRTAFLDHAAEARDILIAGEGHGRFLTECRRKFPAARITVLDASAKMLATAQTCLHRLGIDSDGIEFVHADARNWKPSDAAYDLIATHFFLDCFPAAQLQEIIEKLARAAKPAARWLVADFQLPAHGWRRRRAQIIHAMMYGFFRVVTRLPARRLVCPDDFLASQNFALRTRVSSEWDLLRSDLWERVENQPVRRA